MVKGDIGYQGIGHIEKISFPVLSHPGKLVVNPRPKATEATADVVFLTYVRKGEVADTIALVKAEEKSAVANGNVAGHFCGLPRSLSYFRNPCHFLCIRDKT